MESSRWRELLNEVLLVARGISFQSAAIFLCPKGTTQISHGTRTKYRKTRAMLREFSAVACLALKQLRHLAVRVKPISFALRACFLGHYRMARMSQSASPCGLASWMRPHMVPDAHLLKLLFPTRYTSRSIYQSSMCDSQSASSCGLASSIYIAAIYYYDAFLRFPYKIQTSSYSGRIFAKIKRTKNIDSFEKK